MPPTSHSNNNNKNNNDDDDDDDNSNTTRVSWTGDTITNTTRKYGDHHNHSNSSSSSNEHADTTITTFDIYPTSSSSSSTNQSNSGMNSSSSSSMNRNSNTDASTSTVPNTARWTRYLPTAFGIRHSVESSKYRWCARESALWGIATGSAMAFHRIRMNSPTSRVIHVGFSTVFLVMGGSYYFCVKRRDYQEQMIELLMQLNTFEPVQNMPAERPIDQTHPFVRPDDGAVTKDDTTISATTTTNHNNNNNQTIPTKQYVAHIPERKEWQTPTPTQDAAKIFQPYNNNNNKNDSGNHETK